MYTLPPFRSSLPFYHILAIFVVCSNCNRKRKIFSQLTSRQTKDLGHKLGQENCCTKINQIFAVVVFYFATFKLSSNFNCTLCVCVCFLATFPAVRAVKLCAQNVGGHQLLTGSGPARQRPELFSLKFILDCQETVAKHGTPTRLQRGASWGGSATCWRQRSGAEK